MIHHKKTTITLVILFLISCNGAFYYPSKLTYSDPKEFDLEYDDIYYQSTSGNKLHGRFFPTTTDSSKGLIVHFHGNAENLSSHYFSFAWMLKQGYDYFIWDYSGYGKSAGEASRRALFKDGLSTIDLVINKHYSSEKKLIVIGQSLGGAIALPVIAMSPHHKKVDLLIIESSFGSYQGVAFDLMKRSWLTYLFSPLSFLLVSDELSPNQYVNEMNNMDLWFVHCLNDNVIPYSTGEKYFTEFKNSTMNSFQNCGHTGAFTHWFPENRIILLDKIKKINRL